MRKVSMYLPRFFVLMIDGQSSQMLNDSGG